MRRYLAAAFLLVSASAYAGINPASPGLPTGLEEVSAMCVDCHTNNPKPNSGTHFVVHNAGAAVRNTANTAIEFLGNWPVSLTPSKYGVVVPGAMPTTSTTVARGEMLCESCHNLRKNIAGGNNLLAEYGKTASDTLCITCHATPAGGPPNHHPMTGNNVGPDRDNAAAHVLTTTHTSHLQPSPLPGNDVYYPAANQMSCASCHSPHGAGEGGGARVLRRGHSASATWPGYEINLIYAANNPRPGDIAGDIKIWDTGDLTPGIDRQADITAAFGAQYRLVTNVDPLCDACHAK